MRELIPIAVGFVLVVTAGAAFSHGVGLDHSSCHHDNSNGSYHCHR